MEKQISLNEETFQAMEKDILKQVTDISKSIIETFKFKMLFDLQVTSKQNKKILKGLKEFRLKNWDTKLTKDEAYNNYINLY